MTDGVMAELVGTCPVPGAHFSDSFGAPRSGGRLHQGQDLFAPIGTPVLAAHDGRMEEANNALGGIAARVIRGAGHTYYAHLQRFHGRPNRQVHGGERIGYVDHTGDAAHTADHCHFEVHPIVHPKGLPVSPYGYSWIDGAANSFDALQAACNRKGRPPVHLSILEGVALCYFVGFRGSHLVQACTTMFSESDGEEDARRVISGGREMAGLFQINLHAHPDVTRRCAYNGLCNVRRAFGISKHGTDWSPWTTFQSGRYWQLRPQVLHQVRSGDWHRAVQHIPALFDKGGQGGPGGLILPLRTTPAEVVAGERYASMVGGAARAVERMAVSSQRRDRDLHRILKSWHRWF